MVILTKTILIDRFYIGIDISEEYCKLARERINNSKLQLNLKLD